MTDVDVDVGDLGDVIDVVVCPHCEEDLRLEFRDGVHHEYVVAICPEECYAAALRVAANLDLDSEAGTRGPAGWCVQCQEQVVDPEDAVDVTLAGNDHIVHDGECYEAHRREQQRLGSGQA